jgi:hypothetical protein
MVGGAGDLGVARSCERSYVECGRHAQRMAAISMKAAPCLSNTRTQAGRPNLAKHRWISRTLCGPGDVHLIMPRVLLAKRCVTGRSDTLGKPFVAVIYTMRGEAYGSSRCGRQGKMSEGSFLGDTRSLNCGRSSHAEKARRPRIPPQPDRGRARSLDRRRPDGRTSRPMARGRGSGHARPKEAALARAWTRRWWIGFAPPARATRRG